MSVNEYDLIIIGAGPAGLFCAAHAAPAKTLILEKMNLPGRKLLLTGSGQCNVTHTGSVPEFISHFGEHKNFLKFALMAFSNTDVKQYFEKLNVPLIEKESGKIFPASLLADDILDALLNVCDENHVTISYEEPVLKIEKIAGGYLVKTDYNVYSVKCVVIATGGASYPKTGSSGDGFILAESLGHTIVPPVPALTPVYVAQHKLKDLSGISFQNITITLWRDGKKVLTRIGDLLITGFGYSGPVILDASRYFRAGDLLKISFTKKSPEETDTIIQIACKANGARQIQNLLGELACPERVVRALIAEADVPEGTTGGQLTSIYRKRLVKNFTAYEVVIDHLGGFEISMATAGGISLDEVNKKTCESKISPGLFFIGEVLDIDGDTGGYNLQACFSTAFLAAQRVREII